MSASQGYVINSTMSGPDKTFLERDLDLIKPEADKVHTFFRANRALQVYTHWRCIEFSTKL